MKMRLAVALFLTLALAVPGAAEEPAAPAKPAAAPAPDLVGVLCRNWDARSMPEAPTTEFFTDDATVRLIFQSKDSSGPVPAGHRLSGVVTNSEGQIVLVGRPIVTNGSANLWGTGFRLAGAPWAQGGGEFVFHVLWDDGTTPILSVPFTVKPAARWALLVGIADYPPAGAGGPDLPAPDQDAARMRDLLVGSFGFPADHVTVVTNLEATSARIAKELEALAAKAGPDDAVLFYYEGHGTQIPDLDGDEEDGWDEALATADEKPPLVTTEDQLRMYLSDDRIAELLAKFRTKNVTVIFDSCHSGTAVRAGEEDAPDVDGFFRPMRTRDGFGRKLVQMAEDADRSKAVPHADSLDLDERYVFISAAQSWETSMGGAAGGLFSGVLREALRTSNGESWDQLIARVRPAVQRYNEGQAAQVHGAGRRIPFSLAEADEDAPFVRPSVAVVGAFDPASPSRLPTGVAGKHHVYVSGLLSLMSEQRGVAYDVFAAGDDSFSQPPKGRVVITGRFAQLPQPGGSELTYADGEIVSGTVSRGDRLIPRAVRVPADRPTVGVFYRRGETPTALEKLKAIGSSVIGFLQKDGSVNLKNGQPTDMDFIVLPKLENGRVVAQIYTPSFTFVGSATGTDADIGGRVRDLLVTRHREFNRINRIANPSPAFGLEVVVEGGAGRRAAGETLTFRGITDEPAYIFAFRAYEGGEVQLVATSSQPVTPDKPFEFRVGSDANRKGHVVVKVFASREPIDYDSLRAVDSKGRAEALLAALRKAYPAPDAGADLLGTDGWAEDVVHLDFE